MKELESCLGRITIIYNLIKSAYDMVDEDYADSEQNKLEGIRGLVLDKLDEAGSLIKLLCITELSDTLTEEDIKLLVDAYAINRNTDELIDSVGHLKECVEGYASEYDNFKCGEYNYNEASEELVDNTVVPHTECELYTSDSIFGCSDCLEVGNCHKQFEREPNELSGEPEDKLDNLCNDKDGCKDIPGNAQRGLEIIACALQSDDVEYKRYILDIMKHTIDDMVDSGEAYEVCGEAGISRAMGVSNAIGSYMEGITSSDELKSVVDDYLKSDCGAANSLGDAVGNCENSKLKNVVYEFIEATTTEREEHTLFSDEVVSMLMSMLWEKTNDIEKFVRNIENDDLATVDNDSIELKKSFDDAMLKGNELFRVEVFNAIVSMETNQTTRDETAERIISALNEALDVIYPNDSRREADINYDTAKDNGDDADAVESENTDGNADKNTKGGSELADESIEYARNSAVAEDESEKLTELSDGAANKKVESTTEIKEGTKNEIQEAECEPDVKFTKMWDLYSIGDNRSGLSKLFHGRKKVIKRVDTYDLERALINEVNHVGILRTQGGSCLEFEYSRSNGVTLMETSYLSEVDYAQFMSMKIIAKGSVRAFSDYEMRHRFENNVNYKSLSKFLYNVEPLLKVGTILVGNLVFA